MASHVITGGLVAFLIVGLTDYWGFGGACFPKDVKAWNGLHKDKLTEMLIEYNKGLGVL